MNQWYTLLQDWNEYKAGTRVQMAAEHGDKLVTQGTAQLVEEEKTTSTVTATEPDGTVSAESITKEQLEQAKQQARAEETQRAAAIRATAKALGIEDAADELIAQEPVLSVEQAKAALVDELAKRTPKVVTATVSENDKWASTASTALCLKIFAGQTHYSWVDQETAGLPKEYQKTQSSTWLEEGQRVNAQHQQWSGRRLRDIYCESLRIMGVRNPQGLPDDIAARMALSLPYQDTEAWQHAGGGLDLMAAGAHHTPSHFPNILRDAINKRQRAGFDAAPTTYQLFMRQAPSVMDFKTIYRPLLGEIGDLEEIADDAPFPDATIADTQQTYSVSRYGKRWSITYKAMVNDDLNAFSVIPQRYGMGARTTLNRFLHNLYISNPSIDTGSGAGNLFNSTALATAGGHLNDLGAGAPSVATFNSAADQMMRQQGISSTTLLNIMFRYVVAPAQLMGGVKQLLASTADPTQTSATTEDASRPGFNAGAANIWQGGFVPIFDAILDANSAAAYYFFAEPSIVDTVEYCFLSGFETPRTESEFDFERKGQKMTIEWDFGGAVIDHRGMVRAGV